MKKKFIVLFSLIIILIIGLLITTGCSTEGASASPNTSPGISSPTPNIETPLTPINNTTLPDNTEDEPTCDL